MLRRVLVIDDDVPFSGKVTEYLQSTWPHVRVDHYDPQLGRPESQFDWGRYDLLVLDMELGLDEEDGMDWLRDLRLHADLPATIMVTLHGNEDTVVRIMRLGADDYLNKNDICRDKFVKSVLEVFRFRGHDIEEILGLQGAGHAAVADTTAVLSREQLRAMTSDRTDIITVDDDGRMRARAAVASEAKTRDSAPTSKTLGIRVPGYELIREIARGGMASVLLARREEDRRQVILKVVHLQNHSDPEALRRFMREHALLGKLEHRHIVEIYERAFASDFAYIAMEHCALGDLAQRIKLGVAPENAVQHVREIAYGLGAAHELRIVHRDIKPANILFREDDTLAITDFGVAKVHGSDDAITAVGSLVGTPSYISPEQINGAEADSRSDLYSVGIMFFEMLTGQRPFSASTLRGLLEAHVIAPVPRLPGKIQRYQSLIDGLLAKDPDERFQSTEELLAGLTGV